MRKYILGIILAMLLGLGGIFNADTMALDGDYKNNLLKVDVSKIGDANYNIELYTQKPYSEPVKVIKKSDTSYYVLLPETYHSITSVASSGDVSRVDVKLFPYAGQDLNNGYTKINISTSKPVTFTTNVKTASAQKPHMDAKKLAQLDRAFDSKGAAGKNIPVKIDTVKPAPAQTAAKPEPKAEPKAEVKQPVKVAAVQQPVSPQNITKKPAPSTGTEIEIVTKPKVQEPVKQQEIVKPVDETTASLEEVLETDEFNTEDELAMEEEAKEQGLTELGGEFDEEQIPVLTKKQRIKQALRGVLMQLSDNILLGICIILLLIIALLLVRDKKDKKSAAKEESVQEPYAGLSALNALNAAPQNVSNDAEDIIVNDNYDTYTGIEPAVSETEEYKPESAAVAVAEEETNDEADVLATESFGENRGLCLVNYDGSIALIGYIEDEIFVIQNFGKITLLNPSIQIRVAEQNDNDTIYIVKTANSKLMVRETKELIGLEMVM